MFIRAVAIEVAGLTANPLDRTFSASDTGPNVDSGLTQTTTQASEILIGVTGNMSGTGHTVGTNGTTTTCATSGTSTYTLAGAAGTVTPSLYVQTCIVSAIDAFKSTATLPDNPLWRAAILTYKEALSPTVAAGTSTALSYTEGDGAVPIVPGLTVTDTDSAELSSATASITGGFQSAEDSLGFTNQNGITGSYTAGTHLLTLSGTASKANYETALRSVTYANSSENPNATARTVSFQVTDDRAVTSNTVTRQIEVTAVNDPPVNTVPAAQTTPGNTPRTFSTANGNAISIADVDAGGADVHATLAMSDGTLLVGPAGTQPPLTSITGNGTATVTLVGSLAEIAAALDGLAATPPSGFSGPATLTVTASDLGNAGTGGPLTDIDAVTITVGALPTVSVNDPVAVAEGNSGSANAIAYTVSLSAPSNLAVNVQYATANGPAPNGATGGASCVAGVDYQTTSGTLNFAPTETSKAATVPVCGDTVAEGNETVLLQLGAPTNATIADGLGTGTIADDETTPTLSIADPATATEGNAGTSTVTFAVTLAPPSAQAVTVQYATANGPAPNGATGGASCVAGVDYQTTGGTLSFAPTETSKSVVVTVCGDVVAEGAETFLMNLTSPTGGAAIGDGQAVGTIADDEGAPTLNVADPAAVTEGNAGTSTVTFTVTLAPPSAQAVTVQYATANGPTPNGATGGASCVAGVDYQTTGGTLNFAPTETSKSVVVPICGDVVAEGTETFLVNLATPTGGAAIGDGQAVGTITDDDTAGITVSPTTGLVTTEAGGSAQFSVRLNTLPVTDVTVALVSSDTTEGTIPVAGLTFTPANGTTAQVVTVTGVQDAVADGNVAFTIITGATASADPNYNGLAVPDVALTNTDDETVPTLSLNDPAAVTEGDAGTRTLTFAITLTPPSAQVVTVQFATANGPAPNGATGGAACTAGVDYLTTIGTQNFVPTETSHPITVTVCADTVVEGSETFLVNLTAPTGGAVLGDSQGAGTIADDDAAGQVGLSQTSVAVAENAGTVTLTVQRDATGLTSISTGPVRGTGPITPSMSGGAVPSGSIPSGSIPGGSVQPGVAASPATIGSTVGPAALSAITVDYATSNGTALAGQDYTATAGTLAFGVGETTKTIVVPILADQIDEFSETFAVTLTAPTGSSTLGATTTVTVTISDVDVTPCNTFLSQPVPAGTNVLPVVSQAGCNVGDTVAIEPGTPNEERGTILGFGSIVIQQQTTKVHPAGAVVVRVTGGVPTAQVSPGDDSADDERVERERETEEERRQRARTNQGNRDDDATEGNVVETRCDRSWPSVVIANRDGRVEIMLLKDAQNVCTSIQVGDYLEADGEKQHEGLFHADHVEIRRR